MMNPRWKFGSIVKTTLVSLLMLILLAAGSLPAGADDVYKLKCPIVLGPGTGIWKAAQEWAERVKESSGGRLEIKIFPPGALVGPTQTFESVSKGVIDLCFTSGEYWAGKNTAFSFVTYLPAGFESPILHDYWLYNRGGIELVRKLYAQSNIYLLSLPYYPTEYLMTRVPIRSIKDIKGKKLVFSGAMQHKLFTKLGAATIFMPTGERPMALERGVIDGGDFGLPSTTVAIGADRIAKYMLRPSLHQPSSALELSINMDLWNKLPADLKSVLQLEAYELAWRCYRNSLELDNIALKKMRSGGLKEYTLPAAEVEEVRKIARQCWEEEAQKTEMGKELLESQVAVMKEFGLIE